MSLFFIACLLLADGIVFCGLGVVEVEVEVVREGCKS